jgi:hypothetical protein
MSAFVVIIDRLQLMMNFYTKGKMWRKKKVTLDKLLKRGKPIFDKAPSEIKDYFNSLIICFIKTTKDKKRLVENFIIIHGLKNMKKLRIILKYKLKFIALKLH